MAITSVGFKGTVGQSEDARRWGRVAPRFTVGGATEMQVTAIAGDRTVKVAAGSAQAGAVLATSDGAATVQLPPNTSSVNRYDLIVLRFTWADPIVQPVLTSVQGVTGSGTPNLAGLSRVLGTQYDGLLAVVKVAPGQGTLTSNDVFNIGPYGGTAGALVVPQGNYFGLVDVAPGTELLIADTGMLLFSNGSSWRALTKPAPMTAAWAGPGNLTRTDGVEDSWAQLTYPNPGVAFRAYFNALVRSFATDCEMSARVRAGAAGSATDPNLPIITSCSNFRNNLGVDLTLPDRPTPVITGAGVRAVGYAVRGDGTGSWAISSATLFCRIEPA